MQRKSHKLTQKKLAEDVGVSQRIISDFENGNAKPSYTVLLRLADYFGISLDYLTGRSDEVQRAVEGGVPYTEKGRISAEARALAEEVEKLRPEQRETMMAMLKVLKQVGNEEAPAGE